MSEIAAYKTTARMSSEAADGGQQLVQQPEGLLHIALVAGERQALEAIEIEGLRFLLRIARSRFGGGHRGVALPPAA